LLFNPRWIKCRRISESDMITRLPVKVSSKLQAVKYRCIEKASEWSMKPVLEAVSAKPESGISE
jgi:hypothetical protein